jgi:hypothetical protein
LFQYVSETSGLILDQPNASVLPIQHLLAESIGMSDIFSVLQSAYASAPLTPTTTKYAAVDPKSYQGTWTGTYANNQKFDLTISSVNGFRAQVNQSGSTLQYGQVLIGNSSFRIGDTKFVLTGSGQATVANAVTDPVTGNTSLVQGTATLS